MKQATVVMMAGPLEPYADGFAKFLADRGSKPLTVQGQLRLMARASRWLAEEHLAVKDLTDSRVEEFLAFRRSDGYRDY
ncbi:MAG: hypothetical protein M3N98_03085 [Actinomycetota bacterium]|nr:hypothetical protein [Actinomycetota bacterium]